MSKLRINSINFFAVLLSIIVVFSCKKKDPEPTSDPQITGTPTPVTFNTGLIDYYSFNGDATSYSTSNDGIISGATLVPGIADSAYSYNGTTNSIDLGATVGGGVRTISLWFSSAVNIDTTLVETAAIIYRNDAIQSDEFGIYIGRSTWGPRKGRVTFSYKTDYIVSDSNSWTANSWHHVVAIISPTAGMKMYIDGVLQSDANSFNTTAIAARTEVTTLGTWGDASIRYFNGSIDEVYLWNRELSLTEVMELYNLTATLD
ncbi:MAG: LamG domain-containing protein [Fluviicola sp.]|nr:LamG domain-containing protein [Fluviicola sp.]